MARVEFDPGSIWPLPSFSLYVSAFLLCACTFPLLNTEVLPVVNAYGHNSIRSCLYFGYIHGPHYDLLFKFTILGSRPGSANALHIAGCLVEKDFTDRIPARNYRLRMRR